MYLILMRRYKETLVHPRVFETQNGADEECQRILLQNNVFAWIIDAGDLPIEVKQAELPKLTRIK